MLTITFFWQNVSPVFALQPDTSHTEGGTLHHVYLNHHTKGGTLHHVYPLTIPREGHYTMCTSITIPREGHYTMCTSITILRGGHYTMCTSITILREGHYTMCTSLTHGVDNWFYPLWNSVLIYSVSFLHIQTNLIYQSPFHMFTIVWSANLLSMCSQ